MRQCLLIIFVFFFCAITAQHQDKVDFIRADVSIELIPQEKRLKGLVSYQLKILADVDSIFLDAKNMHFSKTLLSGNPIRSENTQQIIKVHHQFKEGEQYELLLQYDCTPKQTVYFLGWDDDVEGNEQLWTQGQGKYTSHWLPSFDDMEEKVEFDLSIKSNLNKPITIANGRIKEVKSNHNGSTITSFDMKEPMSSYLLAFVIGDYKKQELFSASGIPIENYYYPKDSLKAEPTYRYTKEIFDFLEKEIGFPYPWQNYKQVPVRDFLYSGMENTTTTIFSDTYVIDSIAFVDKNYVNVNAHELAHQWFGNLVTEKDGNHHWLHEGFATYYAYLAEKELFGNNHYYWKLYDTAVRLKSVSDKGEGEALTDPKASSLTFYEKGAWALVMLKDLVGEENFRNGVKQYLVKHQYKSVTITDFLNEIEQASGFDLSTFKSDWLERTELPFDKMKSFLRNTSSSVSPVFAMEDEFQRIQSDDLDYERYWNKSESVHFKKYLIKEYHRILPKELIFRAFETDTVPVRQTLAEVLYRISGARASSESLKSRYETLLEDDSYLTIETALINLWSNFPEYRSVYLNRTKDIVGLPNKNVRLLWLTLALVTPEYGGVEKTRWLNELVKYTFSTYNPEVRQLAFQYLMNINAMNASVYRQLIKATNHHSWQFRNFARRLLDEKLEDDTSKMEILNAARELKRDDLRYLKTKLNLP
ncbi:aminopeptidase [Maribacter sp. 4U21]|uniref:M1 family metallopeptidase n=1 Tax=Maribacter sp. 4U21 TaxID=1889779 RepID=UPI000C14CCD7|nr:M1 family metallopeptidase [Maribacter sp. 4U21]PIB25393.1 aminopeptidase [Maribacter sp. 4U21]